MLKLCLQRLLLLNAYLHLVWFSKLYYEIPKIIIAVFVIALVQNKLLRQVIQLCIALCACNAEIPYLYGSNPVHLDKPCNALILQKKLCIILPFVNKRPA